MNVDDFLESVGTAINHAKADTACGRAWVCACAACRTVRTNGWLIVNGNDGWKAVRQCYVHEDREATRPLNVPCAPEGKIWVCDECHAESGRKAVFDKYFAAHKPAVKAFAKKDAARRRHRNS